MLALFSSPDGRERPFEKVDNTFFMASDKTRIVSIVFLRIITRLFFSDKIIMSYYSKITTFYLSNTVLVSSFD